MILSVSSRGPSMEKFLSRNLHLEIKSFTELLTKYLMKFKKEFDANLSSLGTNEFVYIRNPFIANDKMLQAERGTEEKLI